MSDLKCKLSDVPCRECLGRSTCLIYGERDVFYGEVKRLFKVVTDMSLITDSIIKRRKK